MSEYNYVDNNGLIELVERGLRKGYWDKALIPELRKRFKELEKQEKLLELYKKLSNLYQELYTIELSQLVLNQNYYELELTKIKSQIKEKENDK